MQSIRQTIARPLFRVVLAVVTLIMIAAGGVLATRRQPQATASEAYLRSVAAYMAKSGERPDGHDKYRTIAQLDAQGREEVKSRASFPKLVRGDPKIKEVALTIDDGPYPGYVERLLKILKDADVKATFFDVGRKADQYPELVRMEAADGHEIANHTYSHLTLPKMPRPNLAPELRYGAEALQKAGNLPKLPDIFRPRGGAYDAEVVKAAEANQFTLALWNANPGDASGKLLAADIERIILRDLSPGAIILIHEGVEETMKALPSTLRKIKERGYKFVTCSEMAARPGCIKVGGPNTWKSGHGH